MDLRVCGVQGGARGIHLRRADCLRAVQDLALQVREIDLVCVGEREAPDAGGCQVQGGRAAEAARADDQRARTLQPLLAFDPDLGKKDVAAVAEELLVVQFVGVVAGLLAATVGDTAFTGSPLRWAMACCSWKSSLEPSSAGLVSPG